MNMHINRELTDDCYLEYKPEWTTDVFRWDGGEYIEVGNIDEDENYEFRKIEKIKIPIFLAGVTNLKNNTLKDVLKRFKGWCIDWHESKAS